MSLNQVNCERRTYSKNFKSHRHEHGQFLFPLQGSLDMETHDQKVMLEPNYCFYLSPEANHTFRSIDRNEFLILDIPQSVLPHDTSNMHVTMDENWSAIRFLLLEESQRKNNRSALVNLTRFITDKIETARPRSIEYIHKNFRHPLTLETLAEMEHYHPVYYSAWFKKETGKSLRTYINELRLDEAKALLSSTSWSITTISEETGFENASSFTRWFRRMEDVSPQMYRGLN